MAALTISLVGCSSPDSARSVVIYTSVDRPYSEPILREFERTTGIRVRAVFDLEAIKTTGLVNRILAEAGHPRADVFWNGEFAQTLLLKDRGILAPYEAAGAVEATFRDRDGYWIGFGGRARVILVNTEQVPAEEYPRSIYALLDTGRFRGAVGLAHPLFGTTATHAAALYAVLGATETRAFFEGLLRQGAQVLDGNAAVRDAVVQGRISVGLTDTDDACGAVRRGEKVAVVVPDQEEGGLGTLVIPNTVALIRGGPNPQEGKALVDFLLSRETEEALLRAGWFQTSLRGFPPAPQCNFPAIRRVMAVELGEVYEAMALARQDLAELFLR